MNLSQAFFAAKTLIPKNCDLTKWSVVACDQYTSEPLYWKEVEAFVGDAPSTFHMIVPEIYLESPNVDERIIKVNESMEKYLKEDLFTLVDTLIYVERKERSGQVRRGIMGCIDLEEYDFQKGSSSFIRATEKTVLERIPARVHVRQNAALESPHVMVLIDDDQKEIIEPLSELKSNFSKVYDFDLMQNSGHITGYKLTKDEEENVLHKLAKLEDTGYFAEKYKVDKEAALAYAIGDGNHSLAAAKTCYENLKKTMSKEEYENHPARFALVELVNLHDESLQFEAIHRVLFNVDAADFLSEMKAYYDISEIPIPNAQHFSYVIENSEGEIYVKNPSSNLPVGTFQNFADMYFQRHTGKIDYIHGEDVTKKLGKEKGNIGFLFPCMKKEELFTTVIKDGSLPRKTFSMGHAEDKRFYLECRTIK